MSSQTTPIPVENQIVFDVLRRWTRGLPVLLLAVSLVATFSVANANLQIQGLVLVAAIYGILALCLDATAGMIGLHSLGVGGFFGIGAYLTTIASNDYGVNFFLMFPVVFVVCGILGVVLGAASLRVSGLYFAITTFIFTLVMTVLATDLQLTNGMQGLLGPAFPEFPESLSFLGSMIAWCIMLGVILVTLAVWNIRRSLLYPVLLAIRDAEPFAEAAGVKSAPTKLIIFGLSSATIGLAGWLFCFLGVVSPSQFSWAVSMNVLIMVLIGGINTTTGPLIGASFVSMFPVLVRINPWIQEVLYGVLSILVVTVFPEGFVGLARRLAARFGNPQPIANSRSQATRTADVAAGHDAESQAQRQALDRLFRPAIDRASGAALAEGKSEPIVACRGINFRYGQGPKVLTNVDLAITPGHIHGLIGPNGSGKTTLANIIAGRLRPISGEIYVKGEKVNGLRPAQRARFGLRRTFQAAQLVKELSTYRNVLVGAYTLVPRIGRRAVLWPILPSARRDSAAMAERAQDALRAVGAGEWIDRRVGDVPHGVEQLTQLASVCVANPEIIILDEPATGLTSREIEHLTWILWELKTRGITMIIIEHQTRFLFPLCDQVTVLNAGEVLFNGTADEVRADPVVRKVYLGD